MDFHSLRGKLVVGLGALCVSSAILFALPLMKYFTGRTANAGDAELGQPLKITQLNLDEKKKKIKKVKVKTTRPKLTRQAQTSSRFKLDFGLGGFGDGASMSSSDSANIIYNEGSVDIDPVRVSGRAPEVPGAFAAASIEGRVEVQAVIEANGEVSQLKVILETPPNYQLGRSAAAAMRTWRYRPAMVKNLPVRIRVIVPFIFS